MYGSRRRKELRPVLDEAVRYGAALDSGIAKGAKAFRYATAAASAYRVGKRAVEYLFSKNEKTMPPRPRSQSLMDVVMRSSSTSRSPPRSSSSRGSIYRKALNRVAARAGLGKAVKVSPKIIVRRQGMPRSKSLRQRGATASKSAGKFSKGSKGGYTKMDVIARKGVVYADETGGQVVCQPIETALLIGHTTCTQTDLLRSMAAGLAKLCAFRMKFQIESITNKIQVGAATGRTIVFSLDYRNGLGGTVGTHDAIMNINATWELLINNWAAWFGTVIGTNRVHVLNRIRIYYEQVGTTPIVNHETIASIDLAKAKIHLFAKSSLKIQNRTINVAGNDEADDVDNVPLYGKSYYGNGNYVQYGEANAFIYPDNLANENRVTRTFTVNTSPAEPFLKSQLSNCTRYGKAHLDPGQIKTSVLYFSKTLLVNTLFAEMTRSNGTYGSNASLGCPIQYGKYQMFHLEKMIQSIITSETNSIKVAYEVDWKHGAYVTAPQNLPTLLVVKNSPV